MWHLSHSFWDGFDFRLFFLVFNIENVLFYISGSQTSMYIIIIRGCLLKMQIHMPFAQRF